MKIKIKTKQSSAAMACMKPGKRRLRLDVGLPFTINPPHKCTVIFFIYSLSGSASTRSPVPPQLKFKLRNAPEEGGGVDQTPGRTKNKSTRANLVGRLTRATFHLTHHNPPCPLNQRCSVGKHRPQRCSAQSDLHAGRTCCRAPENVYRVFALRSSR